MAKQIIRLTESDLHNIIKESVRKYLNEYLNLEARMLGPNDRFTPNKVGGGSEMFANSLKRSNQRFANNESYAKLAAQNGNEEAIRYCQENNIEY